MKTLKKDWKEHKFSRCYLFFGAETYLIKRYETALMQAILPTGTEMMNHDIFEEKRATAAAIADAAETMPFMNEKRLITVRNSEFFQKGARKEEGEKLKEFLADIPESTCILFIEEKVEKTNGLYKAVVKYGQAIEFKRPTEKEIALWMKKTCKEYGVGISEEGLELFLRTVKHDMENIHAELMKLIDYIGENQEILAEDIHAVCTISLEARVFDLVKAVAEKKPERAMQIYRHLLYLKESPYMVLSLITRQFRLILETKLFAAEGLGSEEIAEKLELRSFAVKEYLRQGNRLSAEGWKEAMKDCLQTDLDIKTGQAQEETAVELLILKYSR